MSGCLKNDGTFHVLGSFAGYTNGKIKRLITEHGGVMADGIDDDNLKYVILSPAFWAHPKISRARELKNIEKANLANEKNIKDQAGEGEVPNIHEFRVWLLPLEWLEESIEKGELLPEADFDYSFEANLQKEARAKQLREEAVANGGKSKYGRGERRAAEAQARLAREEKLFDLETKREAELEAEKAKKQQGMSQLASQAPTPIPSTSSITKVPSTLEKVEAEILQAPQRVQPQLSHLERHKQLQASHQLESLFKRQTMSTKPSGTASGSAGTTALFQAVNLAIAPRRLPSSSTSDSQSSSLAPKSAQHAPLPPGSYTLGSAPAQGHLSPKKKKALDSHLFYGEAPERKISGSSNTSSRLLNGTEKKHDLVMIDSDDDDVPLAQKASMVPLKRNHSNSKLLERKSSNTTYGLLKPSAFQQAITAIKARTADTKATSTEARLEAFKASRSSSGHSSAGQSRPATSTSTKLRPSGTAPSASVAKAKKQPNIVHRTVDAVTKRPINLLPTLPAGNSASKREIMTLSDDDDDATIAKRARI